MIASSLLIGLLAGSALANTPSKFRVAYHGCDGMSISWSTPEKVQKPSVRYGTSKDLDNKAESSSSTTYPTASLYSNHVVLKGLKPDTAYFYQVEGCDSDVLSFKTCKKAGDMTPYSAAVVVDLGTMGQLGLSTTVGKGAANPLKAGEVNTIDRLTYQMNDYEFIAHPGDIAYADYWYKEEYQGYLQGNGTDVVTKYNAINDAFFDEISAVASKKAYMVVPGNHENNCINGGYKNQTEAICPVGLTNFTEYKNHWNMPGKLSGGQGSMWYSFDYGMTHYLMFNTESDLGNGLIGADQPGGSESFTGTSTQGYYPNQQIDFITKDLAAVNRSVTPWVVAMGHRPWYVASSSRYYTGQAAFEDAFIKYGVDMVIHGHVHNTERTYPIANNVTDSNKYSNPSAPMYIINGAAGHYDGLDPLVYPLPSFTAFANDTLYSYSRLTFHNASHMTHDFVSSATNQVFDSVTLFKKH